jgi:integrase
MPRRPKPFFHRGWWCSNVGGSRTKLARGRKNKAAAENALLDLLSELRLHPDRQTYPQLTVNDLCEKFLDWVELHRAPDTYTDYRHWLGLWAKLHGTRRAWDIQALDLEEWKANLAQRDLSPWTANHAVVAVKTCWSWGLKNGLLRGNTLQKVQKLVAEGRERTLTPAEFLSLLRHSDALFRQVLLFFRLTGIRPGEFARLTWAQVDFDSHVLVLRQHKSRRTAKVKRPRLVHLPPAAENLLRWRWRRHGRTDRVFLNAGGRPWSYNASRCRMRRLPARAGLDPDGNGERVVL